MKKAVVRGADGFIGVPAVQRRRKDSPSLRCVTLQFHADTGNRVYPHSGHRSAPARRVDRNAAAGGFRTAHTCGARQGQPRSCAGGYIGAGRPARWHAGSGMRAHQSRQAFR